MNTQTFADMIIEKQQQEKKLSQTERVYMLLFTQGFVGSYIFYDLRPRILRAASRVNDLRNMGFNIKTIRKDNKFYYQLIKD